MKDPRQWFAMRDLKRGNASNPAYLALGQMGFEVFTPMRETLALRFGIRRKVLRPYLQDLLFVHAEREFLDPVVERTPTLQYRYAKGLGYRQPVVVPERQMLPFIAAAGAVPGPKYYLPEELTPEMVGRAVRIIGGPLDGYEGRLLRLRGARAKRVIVELPNLIALAVEVRPEFIQLISENTTK